MNRITRKIEEVSHLGGATYKCVLFCSVCANCLYHNLGVLRLE